MKSWRADLALVAVTIVWGSSFVIVRDTLRALDPFALVAYRFGLAAGALGLALAVRRALGCTRAELAAGLGLGALLALGFLAQTIGLTTTGAANSGFITGLSVVLTPVFATAITRVAPGRASLAAVVLAAAGLFLLSFRPEAGLNAGDLFTLACAVAFALHIAYTGQVMQRARLDPARLTAVQFLTVAAVATAGALLAGPGRLPAPDGPALAALAYLAVFGSVLAYVVQTAAQRFTSTTRVAIIFTLEPVFAGLFAFTIGAEAFTPRFLGGAGLILAAMLLAELSPPARVDHRKGQRPADRGGTRRGVTDLTPGPFPEGKGSPRGAGLDPSGYSAPLGRKARRTEAPLPFREGAGG